MTDMRLHSSSKCAERHCTQWVYGGAASCQQWRRLPARSHDAPAVPHHRRRHGNDASKRPQQRRANGRLRPGWQGRTRHRHGGASYHRRQSDGATAVAVACSSTAHTRRRALSCTLRRVTGRLAGGPVRRRRRVLVAVCMNVPACVGWGRIASQGASGSRELHGGSSCTLGMVLTGMIRARFALLTLTGNQCRPESSESLQERRRQHRI